MSKKKAKAETMTLWLTRDQTRYLFWLVKPRRRADGSWDHDRLYGSICPQVFHRRFPKAWRLKPYGGPLECELRVKT